MIHYLALKSLLLCQAEFFSVSFSIFCIVRKRLPSFLCNPLLPATSGLWISLRHHWEKNVFHVFYTVLISFCLNCCQAISHSLSDLSFRACVRFFTSLNLWVPQRRERRECCFASACKASPWFHAWLAGMHGTAHVLQRSYSVLLHANFTSFPFSFC